MKKMFSVLFVLFSTASTHKAYSQLEGSVSTPTKHVSEHHKLQWDAAYYGSIKISKKYKFAYAGIYESEIPKFFIGLSYLPAKDIKITGLVGTEKTPEFWGYRLGASFLFEKKEKMLLELMAEKGNGERNHFFRNTFFVFLSKKFYAGIRQWSEHGIGPLVGVKITKHGSLYVMPARYEKENKFNFGLNYEFE